MDATREPVPMVPLSPEYEPWPTLNNVTCDIIIIVWVQEGGSKLCGI